MAVRERISILASKDAKLKDNVSLWFGNGTSEDDGDLGDVEIRWDGTDLDILPAANNSILKIGADAKAFDLWLYGNSSNAYISWDASADDFKFEDSVSLMFGTGAGAGPGNAGDVEIRWDGTDLDVLAAADDSILKIGNGTNSFDVWLFGNSVTQYASWDASANRLKFEDSINLEFGTGAGAGPGNAGDASITFDGTRLVVSPIAAGGIVHIGDAADTAPNEVHIFDGATAGEAGRLVLYDRSGQSWYIWPNTDGDVYVASAAPADDTAGAVIGGQS